MPSIKQYSTNQFQQQENQIQQTKNHDLITAKNTYDINSTCDSVNYFTILNIVATNGNNNNHKFGEVHRRHKNKKNNATKNNQIVDNKYRSKIRRHFNKIEFRIKQNPKNKNQSTDERERIQTQKLGNHQHHQGHDHQNLQKTPNFS